MLSKPAFQTCIVSLHCIGIPKPHQERCVGGFVRTEESVSIRRLNGTFLWDGCNVWVTAVSVRHTTAPNSYDK